MIPFGPYAPDSAAYLSGAAFEALNVVPTMDGYRPLSSFGAVASAITARAQGAISVRDLSGTIHNFCGDATNLYKMASDGLSWDDVSRTVGGDYACPNGGWWDFFQFGNSLIAVNGVDAAQLYTLGTSTNFAALGGSSPVAAFCGTIRGFGVMCRVASAFNRVHWSALEDVTDWAASATTLSDTQDIPDGGAIMGFVSGEYGLVIQERQVSRMVFEGPPTIFRFDKITNTQGCRAERSIASYEHLAFYLSDDGFKMIRGGVEIVDIGAEKVDRFIESDLDAEYLFRISAAIDPVRKLYVMGYASQGAGGAPDSLLMYHWPTGKWSRAEVAHDLIYTAASQSSYTLDTLDTVNGSIDALNHSLDSRIWTGSGRLLLAGFVSRQSGFFDGSNMAATLETGEAEINPGRKTMFRGARPLVQGTSVTPSLSIGHRNRLNDAVAYTSAVAQNSNGFCNIRKKARYHRARLTTASGDTWAHAVGVDDVRATAMGSR